MDAEEGLEKLCDASCASVLQLHLPWPEGATAPVLQGQSDDPTGISNAKFINDHYEESL